ncbi:PaaI family thioesterase [Vibrio sp. AK197]
MRSSLEQDNAMLKLHEHCFACSLSNPWGLAVEFSLNEQSGVVSGEFIVAKHHQGYNGLLHGGLASTLLDAAMTHCLLRRQLPAFTAELNTRYHSPIMVGDRIAIRGELIEKRRSVYFMSASLEVDQHIAVSASAKFMPIRSSLLTNI